MVSVEEIVGNDLVVVIRSMREGAAAIAIAQSPEAGHISLQLIVNDDVAACIDLDPSVFETQVARVWNTPDRQEHVRAYHFLRVFAAFHLDGDTVTPFRQRDAFRIQPNVYALSFQDFEHSLGDVFVLTSNQARSHFHNRNFAPQAAIDLRELQSNITPAHDDEMLGQEIDVHQR